VSAPDPDLVVLRTLRAVETQGDPPRGLRCRLGRHAKIVRMTMSGDGHTYVYSVCARPGCTHVAVAVR
jgi:hypothetical protein